MTFPQDVGVPLICPQCRVPVFRDGDGFVCTSGDCRRRYPIVDDIPKFLIDAATQLSADAWTAALDRHAHAARPRSGPASKLGDLRP